MSNLIYKLCHAPEWADAQAQGCYAGSAKDREDGFIHFSTAEQLVGTLAKYYSGVDSLLLIAVDAGGLGEALRYEPSRDGALFPHLYAPLPLAAVVWSKPIARQPNGVFALPDAVTTI